METLQTYAKLDEYDYELVYRNNHVLAIHIPMQSFSDVIASDISTDVDVHDGYIYVEGHYLRSKSLTLVTGPDNRKLIVIRTEEI